MYTDLPIILNEDRQAPQKGTVGDLLKVYDINGTCIICQLLRHLRNATEQNEHVEYRDNNTIDDFMIAYEDSPHYSD